MQLLSLHGWLEVGVLGLQLFDPNLHLLLIVTGKQKLPEGSRERGREGRREGERGREREEGGEREGGRGEERERGREGETGFYPLGGGRGEASPPNSQASPPKNLVTDHGIQEIFGLNHIKSACVLDTTV